MPTKEPPDSDNDSDVVVITDREGDTPTARSPDDEPEDDSMLEDSESNDSLQKNVDTPSVVWTGYGKRIPVIVFKAEALVKKHMDVFLIGEKYQMAYKMVKTECKLIRSVLSSHGFHEAHPNSNDFNLMWTGSHLKPYTLRGLQEFQKVNHFPRSYEITRKDRLFKNVQRMQQIKGFRHFDFIPLSFIVPGEFQEFCNAYLKDKGPWIVKPVASSRGRGIFLVNHPEQIPLDDTMIVSKYLHNPLLIDGFKFDVRLYVAVTSYDPLTVYMYEEGLTRFATVKYDKNLKNIRNQCMHLTNYSVNKKSGDYVRNDDPDVEDYGNKWSLGAMLRYLRSQGRDTTAMMLRIEDVINKTIISAELPISTACKMFMPFRGNCFEVYGFDILIDDNLRPWVLEVNLSPSLACDSPLDLKIKSNMISDLFSLSGVICHDPMVRKSHQNISHRDYLGKSGPRSQSAHFRPSSAFSHRRSRPNSANSSARSGKSTMSNHVNATGLCSDEIRMVRRAKEEYLRRGGWIRIFPTPDSWELYGSYLQTNMTNNFVLYQQLFPERAKMLPNKLITAGFMSSGTRASKTVNLYKEAYPQVHVGAQVGLTIQQRVPHQIEEFMTSAIQRSLQYERKLSNLGDRRPRSRTTQRRRAIQEGTDQSAERSSKGSIVQGVAEDLSPPEPVKSHLNLGLRRLEESPASSEPTVDKSHDRPPMGKTHMYTMPRYKVVELLEKGYTMTKVQARFAFATYLTRVQHRLMSETGGTETEDVETANEQMDLVLRFLKRAACNLQQAFKVVVPSRKLPLNDRRRILAKQLGDFVHIYNKETDQLRQRSALEKRLKRPPQFSKSDYLDEVKFTQFVNMSTECELEDVLTTYTKLNKSASIFLGSNSKSTYDPRSTLTNNLSTAPGHSETSLVRRKEFEQAQIRAEGASTVTDGSRARPMSASVASAETPGQPARPMTAMPPQREKHDGAESVNGHYDEETINSALQRLAMKQQHRQYTANKASNVLSRTKDRNYISGSRTRKQSWGSSGYINHTGTQSKLEQYQQQQQQRYVEDGHKHHQRRHSSARRSQSNENLHHHNDRQHFDEDYSNTGIVRTTHHQARGAYGDEEDSHSANITFNSYAHESGESGGANKTDTKVATPKSTSHQQQVLKQQKMMEASKCLLEQSKAKHQAMVAQAHAAQKSKLDINSNGSGEVVTNTDSQELVPKPPMNPATNKRIASYRLARPAVPVDDGNANSNFYNSLKYDNSTGTSRLIYHPGYNSGF